MNKENFGEAPQPIKEVGNIEPEISPEAKDEEKLFDKTILEVGCGKRPYFLDTKEDISENTYYIGIDSDKWEIDNSKKYTEGRKRSPLSGPKIEGKIDFIEANANQLPIKNKSIDEIVVKDFFGQDTVEFHYRGKGLLPKKSFEDYFQKIIDEFKRVLKQNGEMKIIEVNTPIFPDEYIPTMGKFQDFLQKNGFQLETLSKSEDSKLPGYLADYNGYIATFRLIDIS